MTGNLVGVRAQREALRGHAIAGLLAAGAHYVIDGIANLPRLLPPVGGRLALGGRPI